MCLSCLIDVSKLGKICERVISLKEFGIASTKFGGLLLARQSDLAYHRTSLMIAFVLGCIGEFLNTLAMVS